MLCAPGVASTGRVARQAKVHRTLKTTAAENYCIPDVCRENGVLGDCVSITDVVKSKEAVYIIEVSG